MNSFIHKIHNTHTHSHIRQTNICSQNFKLKNSSLSLSILYNHHQSKCIIPFSKTCYQLISLTIIIGNKHFSCAQHKEARYDKEISGTVPQIAYTQPHRLTFDSLTVVNKAMAGMLHLFWS